MFIDTAVIVEPRLHQYLKPVIDNIIRNTSNETVVHIFHGNLNKSYLESNYNVEIKDNKIKLTDMNISNLTVKQYSDMLTSVNFWNMIEGENILIFQTDSCICNHIDNFDLSSFNDYGFVGAPCKDINNINNTWQNGGFSLRKRSLMIDAITDKKMNESTWPEDKYFSVIKKHITNPAPYYLATTFSVEIYYSDNPFGIHKSWNYLQPKQWIELKRRCPEIGLVFNF
jgi:hypothetical protein